MSLWVVCDEHLAGELLEEGALLIDEGKGNFFFLT